MSNPELDIVIVGAGITGAALARSLSGLGLRLGLVEAAAIDPAVLSGQTAAGESHAGGEGVLGFDARVSAIAPSSQALFETLGIWNTMAAGACRYRHMSVWDAEGTGAIDFDAAELDVPALGHILENRAITAALLAGIADAGDISLFNPARVATLHGVGGGRWRLLLEDGRELWAGLVVGADGVRSRVRDMAGFQTREWDYGHRAIVSTVQTEKPHRATAWQRFLDTGPLALLPLPDRGGEHFCSVVWSAQTAAAEQLEVLPDGEFCNALAEASEYRLGDILSASPRFGFPLRQCHATDYVQPGIALVGDAAHSIHPLAGQGVNLGLRDAQVLAEELNRGGRRGISPGDIALLRRYQRRRKGENLLMAAAMDGFKYLFEEQGLPLRWLRNTGMRLVGQAGPLKRQLVRHAMGVH